MDEFADKKVIGHPVFADFGNQGDNFLSIFFLVKRMNELVIYLVQLSFYYLLIMVSDSTIEILLPVCDDDLCTKSFIYLYLSDRISPVSTGIYTCM